MRFGRHDLRHRTHLSVASFAAFFPCSKKFAYCKRWLNAAETWQRGYESVSFVARYSFLHCWADLDEAQSDNALHPGSLLRIWYGPLHGDSWTIQAPSPCNRPPSIFGAWAVSAHGRLLRTIRYLLVCDKSCFLQWQSSKSVCFSLRLALPMINHHTNMVSKCQLSVLHVLPEGKCAIKRQPYNRPFTLRETAPYIFQH